MPRLRYRAVVALAATAAGLLAACSSSGAHPLAGRSLSPGAGRPTAPSTVGLLPASPALTDRIILDRTHVTAGALIKGTLVIVNSGHAPVNLNHGCRPQYALVLTNRQIPARIAFPADCSTAPLVIAPGQNRFAVTLATSYLSCTPAGSRPSATSPACLGGQTPPLPAGGYQAILVGAGLPLPAPRPVPVILSPAPPR